jgi:hypothetical protein
MSSKQSQHNPPQIKVDKMEVDEAPAATATNCSTLTAAVNNLGTAAGHSTGGTTKNDFQNTGDAVEENAMAENDPLGFFICLH